MRDRCAASNSLPHSLLPRFICLHLLQIGVAYAFTLVGFLQMSQWALQKHAGYKKADESYKKLGRKAIVPFLL